MARKDHTHRANMVAAFLVALTLCACRAVASEDSSPSESVPPAHRIVAALPAVAAAPRGGRSAPENEAPGGDRRIYQQTDRPARAPFVYTTWRTFTTEDGLPHNRIRTIHPFGERVWVGTDGGLALWESDSWKCWTTDDGLPWPVIAAIDVDPRTGDVWLGTFGGGLVRYSFGRFDQFEQFNSGLAGDLVFAVAVDGDYVWAATNSGLSRYDTLGRVWSLHLERRGDTPGQVVTALQKNAGDLYAHIWCGPAKRFDPGSGLWTPVDPVTVNRSGTSPAVQRLGDLTLAGTVAGESLWRATPMGLSRRDAKGHWETRRIDDLRAAGGPVHCLTARADGAEAWLGTDAGLTALVDWAGDRWVTYRRDGEGHIAILRQGGRATDRLALDCGIPDNRVRCLAYDREMVWVGTAKGLALGSKPRPWDNFKAAAAGATPTGDVGQSGETGQPPGPPGQTEPPEPSAGEVVTIAALGPASRTVALPQADPTRPPAYNRPELEAVQLAVEEANARGGYRGKASFAFVGRPRGFFRYGWTTTEDDFGQHLVHTEVMGIVGRIPPDNRFTSAVALHAEMPVVNASVQPPSVDERINPWIFRCAGDRPRQYRLALDHILDTLGIVRFAVLRTADSLGGTPLDRLTEYARSRESAGVQLVADLPCDLTNLDAALRTVQEVGADAVITWCDAQMSAAIVRGMRQAGMSQVFVGSDQIVGPEFIRLVGDAPGKVRTFYRNRAHYGQEEMSFAERYRKEFKRLPSDGAFSSYQATRHLLEAINQAGPDRRAIRRVLESMSRDPDGENACPDGPITHVETIVARLEGGKWRFQILKSSIDQAP